MRHEMLRVSIQKDRFVAKEARTLTARKPKRVIGVVSRKVPQKSKSMAPLQMWMMRAPKHHLLTHSTATNTRTNGDNEPAKRKPSMQPEKALNPAEIVLIARG
jgi:hypothetical protein